jgi:hypothetical protein
MKVDNLHLSLLPLNLINFLSHFFFIFDKSLLLCVCYFCCWEVFIFAEILTKVEEDTVEGRRRNGGFCMTY